MNGLHIYIQGRYAYLTDSGTTNAFEVWDLGGAYIQQLETGASKLAHYPSATISPPWTASSPAVLVSDNHSVSRVLPQFSPRPSTFNTTANIFNIATASSTNSILSVLGNGNVGIGTTTPNTLLTLSGNGSNGSILQLATFAELRQPKCERVGKREHTRISW